MKWKGETEAQWLEKTKKWHLSYCWLPIQMPHGKWVWLEHVWRRRSGYGVNGRWNWEYSDDTIQPLDLDFFSSRPPKPKPTKP